MVMTTEEGTWDGCFLKCPLLGELFCAFTIHEVHYNFMEEVKV